MTDTAVAVRLPAFEGQDVVGSTVRVTRAGDGLSDALELEPEALHRGDERVFILRGRVAQVNHRDADPKNPDGPAVRQHTIVTTSILMVAPEDEEPLERLLTENEERIAHRKKEIAGTPALDEHACEFCEAIFESSEELETHVMDNHDEEDAT